MWYLCILNPLSWPLGITLGTCAFGVDLPLSGGETTSKCCIVGIFILPDLGGGCGGTLGVRLGGNGGGTEVEVGGNGVVEFDPEK